MTYSSAHRKSLWEKYNDINMIVVLTPCWRDIAPEEGTPYRPPNTDGGPCGGKNKQEGCGETNVTQNVKANRWLFKLHTKIKDNLLSQSHTHTHYKSHILLSSHWQLSVLIYTCTSWRSPAGGCSWLGRTEIHADQRLEGEQTSQRRRSPRRSCSDLASC